MRYTTIIDISGMRSLYQNQNVRLVYLHLVLKSGYHDSDRDLYDCSIRELAWEVGMTVAAVRHALSVLERAGLVQREGLLFRVKKWLIEESITPRPKTEKAKKASEVKAEQKAREAALEQERERERASVKEMHESGKTPFMVYYEGLQEQARNGDADASKALLRHKSTYEAHKRKMEEEQAKKKRN